VGVATLFPACTGAEFGGLGAAELASLDSPADQDTEAAGDVEIERRIAAIGAGTIRLKSRPET
jgi:hypothetical protein